MKLAILFWIYKDVDVCLNRARWLRRMNGDAFIYCLFGGTPEDAPHFEAALTGLIDDFYAFDLEWNPKRKWLHGDLMIARWYSERGAKLDWDTIFVAQWDLAILTPVAKICGTLNQDQLLMPGLRPISEVEHFWWWLRPGSDERKDYERFKDEIASVGDFPDEPLCCNFLAAAFPRSFLSQYAAVATETGFLEYKIPIFAQIWGFEFCEDHALSISWRNERAMSFMERNLDTLHAEKYQIKSALVVANWLSPWGRRVFHPYHRAIPSLDLQVKLTRKERLDTATPPSSR